MKDLINHIKNKYSVFREQDGAIFFQEKESCFVLCFPENTTYMCSDDGSEFYGIGSKAKTTKSIDKFVSLRV